MPVVGALLAAGSAERFGAPKVLLPAGLGETVLSRAVRALLSAVDGRVLVVVPAESRLHAAALEQVSDPRVQAIPNPQSAEGLGTSVAVAARAAKAEGADALLLMPADLPYYPVPVLTQMAETFRAALPWAIATAREGRAQTPALFSAQALSLLADRTGPRGAQPLLASPAGRLLLESGVREEALSDLDRWPAYAAAAQALGWDQEAAPPVRWVASDAPQELFTWRLGERTQCHFGYAPVATGILGVERAGTALLYGQGGPQDALRLLRCGALIELRRGKG
ncbi:MAG: NTP transferase domain-containing protein [Thermaerobacter sp.]|nr:NTP transferase domain-containing protein [Thermaerobacter sp.]